MDQKQTGSFVITTREIRSESCRSIAWYHWVGMILSWILNKAADVVGWVSQNLWALVVGIVGLLYTHMVTKN